MWLTLTVNIDINAHDFLFPGVIIFGIKTSLCLNTRSARELQRRAGGPFHLEVLPAARAVSRREVERLGAVDLRCVRQRAKYAGLAGHQGERRGYFQAKVDGITAGVGERRLVVVCRGQGIEVGIDLVIDGVFQGNGQGEWNQEIERWGADLDIVGIPYRQNRGEMQPWLEERFITGRNRDFPNPVGENSLDAGDQG